MPKPEPAHPTPPDLIEAANALLPEVSGLVLLPRRDDLAKATTPGGDWSVCRWSEASTEARIAGAHAGMAAARPALGALVPQVAERPNGAGSTVRVGAHLFDAWSWLPGRPVEPTVARWPEPTDRVTLPGVLPDRGFGETVAAVARLHAVGEGQSRPPAVPDLPLPGLLVSVGQAWGNQRAVLRPVAVRTPAVQRWLALSERALPAAEATLTGAPPEVLGKRTLVHLGLWPGHVLLEDDHLAGLLGWESVAWGPALLDLAQAIVRLRGWTAANVELALAAYADEHRIDAETRRLLPAVGVLDLVASTGSLLVAGYATGLADQPPTALRVAVRGMLASLEAATGALIQSTAAKKSPSRRPAGPGRRPGPPRAGAGPSGGRGGGKGPGSGAGRGPAKPRGSRPPG